MRRIPLVALALLSTGAFAETWIVPSAAKTRGANGSNWATTLYVLNATDSDADVTFKFLGHDVDGRDGEERTITFLSGSGGDLFVFGGLFERRIEGYGAVLVTGPEGLVVSAHTETPSSCEAGGRYGDAVPAFGEADLIRPGAPRVIAPVIEDGTSRTNLVLANASDEPVDVDVAIGEPHGIARVSHRLTLPPLGMTQINRAATTLGGRGALGVWLVISTPTPGGRIAAYASQIDNVTNDPRTLLPR